MYQTDLRILYTVSYFSIPEFLWVSIYEELLTVEDRAEEAQSNEDSSSTQNQQQLSKRTILS